VVNGSRAALPAIRAAFGRVVTIRISCCPEILAARLAARGREDPGRQQARLARSVTTAEADREVIEIDNSGALSTAGDALLAAIRSRMTKSASISPGREA
jgi:ribose 1,5-bisphosphokinase